MKVAPLLREMFTADEKTRKLCRLLQREVKDSSGIVSSYLGLQESGDIIDNFNESTDPEERELTLLKMVSERRFSAIADVSNDGIKPILQKFLAIQMLIGFWERNSCSGRKQAENIEQLTFGSPIQHKHLSNYLQMSGCKPRGAKLLKDMIASIRSEATEYFSEEAKAEAVIRDI